MAADKVFTKRLDGKTNGWFSLLFTVLIMVAIVVVVVQIYKATKQGAAVLGDILGSKAIEDKTGIPPARQFVCKQITEDAKAAVSWWPFTSNVFSVNDEEMILALNKCVSTAEAAYVSQLYRELTGNSLRLTINEHFYSSNKPRLQYLNALV